MITCSFQALPHAALSKEEIYNMLIEQIRSFFSEEKDLMANLANTASLMKIAPLPFFWVGFYIVKGADLVLGPFQGDPATPRISFGEGVCGAAWKERKTQIVPDVHLFPGHIACSCLSQSEIVVPIFSKQDVVAVLDIDSENKNDFDQTDAHFLELLVDIIGDKWIGK